MRNPLLRLTICPNNGQVREDLRLQSERLRALLGLVEVAVGAEKEGASVGVSCALGGDRWIHAGSSHEQARRVPQQVERAALEDAGAAGSASSPLSAALAAFTQTRSRKALAVTVDSSPAPIRRCSETLATVLPGAHAVRVSGDHAIDPAAPEVIDFLSSVISRLHGL